MSSHHERTDASFGISLVPKSVRRVYTVRGRQILFEERFHSIFVSV